MARQVSPLRVSLSQVLAVSVNNLIVLSGGMIVGFTTVLIPGLLADQGDTNVVTENDISWIGSIGFMTSILGCLLSGPITQPIGRIRALLITCPLLVVSFVIFKISTEMWHVYAALGLLGCLIALLETPMLAYKSEVCEPHLRGVMSAIGSMIWILGVLLQIILGTFFHWRTVALISSVVPTVSFILLFFVPESPHWLLMQNKIDRAKRNLAWLRGWTTSESVQEEFQIMCNNYRKISSRKFRRNWTQLLRVYARKSFLWPLALASFVSILSNFTGIRTLLTYAVAIFGTFQAPMNSYYAAITLGVTQLLGSFVCVIFVKYLGKRKTAFISVVGVGVCNMIIGIYALTMKINHLSFEVQTSERNDYAWGPLCILIALSFVGNAGIRGLPWILLPELFSHETRAVGCGIGSASYFLVSFLANKVFLVLIFHLEISGVCWLYASICVCGVVVLYFFLPETEGKELQEIIDHFSEVSRLSKGVGARNKQDKESVQTRELLEK